jgi:glycosyltransferase involved in cell wall biosynthesis
MAAMCRFSLNGKKRKKLIVSSIRCMEIYKPGWRMLLDRWALGKADLVLSVSEAVMKKYLEREKLQGHKIRVVYHGVEHRFLEEQTKESEIRVKLGIGREDNIIGTVARLHEDKGINILLEAFALALKSRPQIRLLIIGNGPEKDKLIEMAKELEITDRVIFTGFQPDVLPLMSLLDIFCLSSKEEGFPQALLEAMALGKPAIVSNVGGVIELIEDSINGILIPPGNPEAFCQSVLNLLQNPHRAQKIGNMAREKIKKKLLIDHTIDSMETIYIEMFKNNSKA